MNRRRRLGVAILGCAFLPLAGAQQAPTPTLAERVTALERQVARLDTRFGIESATRPGVNQQGGNLVAKVDDLERSIARLAADLQRVQRQADDASRTANQAARDAQTAQQMARDAAMRAR